MSADSDSDAEYWAAAYDDSETESEPENLTDQKLTAFMEKLSPKLRERVEALRAIQCQHDELEAKCREAIAAVEAQYQKLYEPLYSKRSEIVNGGVEAEGITEDSKNVGKAKANEGKGVPDFWLMAMKNNTLVAEELKNKEGDEEALKFLKDIKWCSIENPKGFKLEFFFDTNPFFKNTVLTKTYHTVYDNEQHKTVMEKTIGSHIEWFPDKALNRTETSYGVETGDESFFNFFNPTEDPDYDEEEEYLIEQDYDIGCTFRDKITPRAVSWFTGVEHNESESADEDDYENYYYDFNNGRRVVSGEQIV